MRSLTITNTITRREEKSLDKYLTDIGKYPVLTPKEEFVLFQEYKGGDKNALNKIIQHNLRFVVSVAKQYFYVYNSLWLGDLINEGNIGLLKAAHRFDETKGFKFISYAVWWIRQNILMAIKEKSRKIRLPNNLSINISKIATAKELFLQKHEREASIEELASSLDLPYKHIKLCEEEVHYCQSLDAPLTGEEDLNLGGLLQDKSTFSPDYDLVVKESQRIQTKQLVSTLPEKYALVIKLYFGLEGQSPMSLEEISNKLGRSRERIRQLKTKALRVMRQHAKRQRITPA